MGKVYSLLLGQVEYFHVAVLQEIYMLRYEKSRDLFDFPRWASGGGVVVCIKS
jgi:hypothetical protein